MSKPPIRLYVPQDLREGHMQLDKAQAHYLGTVMRCSEGDMVAMFNGGDGEWLAEITEIDKKSAQLRIIGQRIAQRNSPDLWLAFAPVKNKTEIIVEKAVELGVSKILPVVTHRTVVRSINDEKLSANAIEAAEQSERHDVPVIEFHKDLAKMLGSWPKDRTLLYADESGAGKPLGDILKTLPKGKYALLVGPEGGFTPEEQQLLRKLDFVKPFGMGPRIMRADTAVIAALACIQSWLGDWHQPPHFKGD